MARIPLDIILRRAVRLRCPRCGESPLFAGFFRMHASCTVCELKYERAPGYFLGSIYINYALTSAIMTVAYIVTHFFLRLENRFVMPPLVAFCVIFPAVFFRYARSFWLAMDCYFDAEGFGLGD